MIEVMFNVKINSDNILEENEKFHLTINSIKLPERVIVDDPHNITVTILDDDCK